MNNVIDIWNKGLIYKIALGGTTLILICCVCGLGIMLIQSVTPKPNSHPIDISTAIFKTAQSISSLTPASTSIKNPTYTPTPTVDPDAHLRKYEGECAFCFVDGSEPGMPILDGEGPGYKPQPDDPREQIVLDENFSVPVGEEVIIDNKIVWVRSDDQEAAIEVQGTLIIRNSLVLWDQITHHQIIMYIRNGGTLNIESSYAFSANQYWVNWDYHDGSTVLLDNYVGTPWTVIFGSVNYTAINYSSVYLGIFGNVYDTSIIISDAHSMHFEISPSPGEHEITLPAKFEWVDWQVVGLWPETTVDVKHSYLFERDITLLPDTHLTLRDVPSGLGFGWNIRKSSSGMVECELHGLGNPDQESVFYENQSWDLPCINSSLTLINSRLQKAWPMITGNVHLKIYDSSLIDPRALSSPAILEIYDSALENVAANEGGKVYLENVRIKHDLEVKGTNSIIYGYGVMPWNSGWQFEIIKIDGGQYIELDEPGLP